MIVRGWVSFIDVKKKINPLCGSRTFCDMQSHDQYTTVQSNICYHIQKYRKYITYAAAKANVSYNIHNPLTNYYDATLCGMFL